MKNMYFGDGYAFSEDPEESQINRNVAVVGGSGSGKTMSVMEMKLLHTDTSHNMIVNVSKRKLIYKYKPFFEEKGYTVKVLDFDRPESGNACFDPFDYIHGSEDWENIKVLSSQVLQVVANDRDAYWYTAGESLFLAEIYYLMETKNHVTINDVIRFHKRMHVTGTEDAMKTDYDKKFQDLGGDDLAVNYWNTFRTNAPRTAQCIFSQLNDAIFSMFDDKYLDSIGCHPSVKVRDLCERPTVIFVYTSPVNKSRHALANLFIADMIKELYNYAENTEEGVLPRPVDLLFDDFACGARVAGFPEYISIFREKGIGVMILLQDESQLAHTYSPEDAKIIINNCDTYIYMGGMDLESIENVARRINTPNEDVADMPLGTEYIIRRGLKPIRAQRYAILNDREYQAVTRRYELDIQKRKEKRKQFLENFEIA